VVRKFGEQQSRLLVHQRVATQRFSPTWAEYELIDTGGGRKLERFGSYSLIRPEPQAKWSPALPESRWEAADAAFVRSPDGRGGEWNILKPLPERWEMRRDALRFWVQPTPSGHVGVFADQACHWDWITKLVQSAACQVNLLSLFGHTGLATLAAAAAGARVTHVDASRKAVKRARENQALSGLSDRPIRWIVEDALRFVTREAKRGHKYDALLLDPPQFGRGSGGEIWKLDESLPALLHSCRKLLSDSPTLALLNTYNTVLTRTQPEKRARDLESYLTELLSGYAATITTGELVLVDSAGRRISASIFARALIGRIQAPGSSPLERS
jgi:23S rRNA (cytosine1962-C5)-methyltransferase